MKNSVLFFFSVFIFSACADTKLREKNDFIIASGQMPNLVKDKENTLHLVYGSGDSIMYSRLSPPGNSFSSPLLIGVVPKLAASHSRGPQIAATNSGLTVIACNSYGDIFSFNKMPSGNWVKTARVNDVDTVAKENLIALGGDKEHAFAVWLDLRGNMQNKIYGSNTEDGGRSWSVNKMIYTSPDTTVCECCKPSVVVKGNNIYVMFRNWLDGNRDMYMIRSTDGGNTFTEAQKLGSGNWKLNGCPMDGGALAVSDAGEVQTVWRREDKLYTSIPGIKEKEIGMGKAVTVEFVEGKPVYAWAENGEVIVMTPGAEKKNMGKGSRPVLKAFENGQVICVWENELQIHAGVIEL